MLKNSKTITNDDDYSYPLHMSGSVSTNYDIDDDSIVAALHQVVFEITGKEVIKPKKQPMGFY